MYRYRLNPTTGLWEIQLLVFGLFWRSIKTERGHQSYAAASKRGLLLGLNSAYDEWTSKGMPRLLGILGAKA